MSQAKSVEEVLAPLIEQVTTLSEEGRKQRRPHKASKLVQIIEKATGSLLAVGEAIASENPDFQGELLSACEEVRKAGDAMRKAAGEFSRGVAFQPEKRSSMSAAGKDLLLAVGRLLAEADAVDVAKLLSISYRVEAKLRGLVDARDEEELMVKLKDCAPDIATITQMATLRQNDIRSEASQQMLAAAQTELNQVSKMLISSSKVFLHHPEVESARTNRDFVVGKMLEALKMISVLSEGKDSEEFESELTVAEVGGIASAFAQFETTLEQCLRTSKPRHQTRNTTATNCNMTTAAAAALEANDDDTATTTTTTTTTETAAVALEAEANLQAGMDRILEAAKQLTDLTSTRDYRQHGIITSCGRLKLSLQELVEAFGAVPSNPTEEEEKGGQLATATHEVKEKADALKKELLWAVIDHVSDAFLDTGAPVNALLEAASLGQGDGDLLGESEKGFTEHAQRMEQAARLASSLSQDANGIRMVKIATNYVHCLRPQVVSAAMTLSARPDSQAAQKNTEVFREAWRTNTSLLCDTIDSIVPLQDFLQVTADHIREDSRCFLQAVEECKSATMVQWMEAILQRSGRLCQVVQCEVIGDEELSPDAKRPVEVVLERFNTKVLPWFQDVTLHAADMLHTTQDSSSVNMQVIEEAAQKVNDGVSEVKKAVSRCKGELEELESDVEDLMMSPPHPLTPRPSLLSNLSIASASPASLKKRFVRTPMHSLVFDQDDATRSVMAQLPVEKQAQLEKEAEGLKVEKDRLESEVHKWKDSSNDIIVLAKEMCMMVMDMSSFTRGAGPLRSTMDVIITAKDIARAGEFLDVQARFIAEQCPDMKCKKDLLVYLERIQLYCHQLKITSNVKADLKTSEQTVESASALIFAAKNLMNAVVQTVMTCYIASTIIIRTGGSLPQPYMHQWKMAAPKKKKLYQSNSQLDQSVLKETPRQVFMSPIYALGEFKGRNIVD